MAAIQTMKRSDKQKEPAALIFSNTAGSKWAQRVTCSNQRFFSFPVGRGRLLSLIEIKKEPITTRGSDLVCYWLCVCASGSLITVILNCFTWIKVSCLHFGQNSGKFLSSVSFRIFNLVLFPQTGHNIQFSLSIFYYSPLILLLTIRGSELLQLLRLRTLHSRLYLQDNHWHTVLLFPL